VNILGEDHDPADRAGVIAVRPDLPAHAAHRAIEPHERLGVALDDLAIQAAPMDEPPVLGQLGEHLVVTAAAQLLAGQLELVIRDPSPAHEQVSHVAIEHRDRIRAVSR
jgi:hypothetical protein